LPSLTTDAEESWFGSYEVGVDDAFVHWNSVEVVSAQGGYFGWHYGCALVGCDECQLVDFVAELG